MIKSDGTVYTLPGGLLGAYNGQDWVLKGQGGTGYDIGAGGDGSTWLVGTDDHPYVYKPTGDFFSPVPAPSVGVLIDRIAVGTVGAPYVVATPDGSSGGGAIYFRFDGAWSTPLPGTAHDVGIASNTFGKETKQLWVIGTENSVYKEKADKSGFTNVSLPTGVVGANISVDPLGLPWVTSSAGNAYYYRTPLSGAISRHSHSTPHGPNSASPKISRSPHRAR